MIAVLFAATVLLADTTPAAAQAATPAAPAATAASAAKPAAKTAKSDKDQLVCHNEVATGSLFPTKTCYRKDEAAERRREEQLQLYQSQSHGLQPQ